MPDNVELKELSLQTVIDEETELQRQTEQLRRDVAAALPGSDSLAELRERLQAAAENYGKVQAMAGAFQGEARELLRAAQQLETDCIRQMGILAELRALLAGSQRPQAPACSGGAARSSRTA